jgi:chorismate synthase
MTLRFLTSGESHGPALVAILEGLPAGLALTCAMIDQDLARRQKSVGAGARMKIEHDEVRILGGVMGGMTTGAPLALLIENKDHARWRNIAVAPMTIPRPGHADLTGAVKYGYRDLRPALERASARETAARVAVGAACRILLAQFGIWVGGYISSIGEVAADLNALSLEERITRAQASDVSCPQPEAAEAMRSRIRQAMKEGETLGGVIEVVALGLPPGLGSYAQWNQRLEARLGAAVLSIPAIKGVEFGPAFENTRLPGTQVQDAIEVQAGVITRPSYRNGGLEAGITTGQPLLVRAAMKPIPTTIAVQRTVNLANGEACPTKYERSDFCPVPRAVVVVEAMVVFVLAQALLEKLGGDSLAEMAPRFAALRGMRLADLPVDNTEHTWWPE